MRELEGAKEEQEKLLQEAIERVPNEPGDKTERYGTLRDEIMRAYSGTLEPHKIEGLASRLVSIASGSNEMTTQQILDKLYIFSITFICIFGFQY